MKFTRFSWIKMLLLNIVTCGIYGIYAWYKINAEHNEMAKEVEGTKPVMNYILGMLLGSITCGIFFIVWYYQHFALVKKLSDAKNAGVSPSSPIVMIIMIFIPIYSFYWMAKTHNQLVDAYEAA